MATLITIAVILCLMLVSITLHEAMHAYASNWLGDDTARLSGRLTLNPISHIDPFLSIVLPIMSFFLFGIPFGGAKPVPFNPYRLRYGEWGSALVAIAGPLTNLAIAIIVGLSVRITEAGTIVSETAQLLVIMNIALFVFNMIPLPPLDGSRVLYALAPDSIRDILKTVERYGIFVLFFVVIFFQQQFGEFMLNITRFLLGLITGSSVI